MNVISGTMAGKRRKVLLISGRFSFFVAQTLVHKELTPILSRNVSNIGNVSGSASRIEESPPWHVLEAEG